MGTPDAQTLNDPTAQPARIVNTVEPSVEAKGVAISSHIKPNPDCRSLNRPNIDCVCVSQTLRNMDNLVDNSRVSGALRETYKFYLGKSNEMTQTVKALETEGALMYLSVQRLDPFGGWPSDIRTFEQSCVIPNTNPVPISAVVPNSFESEAVRNYQAVGDSARMSTCRVNTLRQRLTENQFIAEIRGHSDYLGLPSILPLLPDARERVAQAKETMQKTEDRDYHRCRALTFADKIKASDIPEPVVVAPQPAASTMPTTALDLVTRNCALGQKSALYCGCYVSEYNNEIVISTPPKTAMAHAILSNSNNMEQAWVSENILSMDAGTRQEAIDLLTANLSLGQSCR